MVFVDYPEEPDLGLYGTIQIHAHDYSFIHEAGRDGPVAVMCMGNECGKTWTIGESVIDDGRFAVLLAAARGALLGGAHEGDCQTRPCQRHRELATQRVDTLRAAVEACL